jgi:hypothetical protein
MPYRERDVAEDSFEKARKAFFGIKEVAIAPPADHTERQDDSDKIKSEIQRTNAQAA